MFTLIEAVVETSDQATYTLVIRPSRAGVNGVPLRLQAVTIASILGSVMGVRQCILPTPGSRVLAAWDPKATASYVFGVLPETCNDRETPTRTTTLGDDPSTSTRARMGYGDSLKHDIAKPSMFTSARPTDVVDGELVYANELGVLMGLYPLLAQLKGSELAQIQCHVLDDLVRLISHNFEHLSAFGTIKVTHDGDAVFEEKGYSHVPWEAHGLVDRAGKPLLTPETDADVHDSHSMKEDTGFPIHRLRQLTGKLGDMVRMFLSYPNPARDDKNTNAEETPDLGLFDVHLAQDGRLTVRSASAIIFEHVGWIRVPERVLQADDPSGNKDTTFTDIEPFDWDDNFTSAGGPIGYALQIRKALSYLNEQAAFSTVKDLDKDFHVNGDPKKEFPFSSISKIDDTTRVQFNQFRLGISGWYLLQNGGILMKDAWGSAVVMEGGDIAFHSAKDVYMQPLRHFVAKVGGSTSFASRKSTSISSTEDAVLLKADKAVHLFSQDGSITLETASPNPPLVTEDLHSPAGGIVMKSASDVRFLAEDMLAFNSTYAAVQAESLLLLEVKDGPVSFRATQLLSRTTDAMVMVSDGVMALACSGTFVAGGAGATILGQKDQVLTKPPEGASFGNIGLALSDAPGDLFADVSQRLDDKLLYDEIVKVLPTYESAEELKFKFKDSAEYGLSEDSDAMFESMAKLDNDLHNRYSLADWTERPVHDTLPFPGKDLFDSFLLTPSELGATFDSTLGIIPDINADNSATLTRKSLNTAKYRQ